jgi:hypothetical protein
VSHSVVGYLPLTGTATGLAVWCERRARPLNPVPHRPTRKTAGRMVSGGVLELHNVPAGGGGGIT